MKKNTESIEKFIKLPTLVEKLVQFINEKLE